MSWYLFITLLLGPAVAPIRYRAANRYRLSNHSSCIFPSWLLEIKNVCDSLFVPWELQETISLLFQTNRAAS